MLKEIASGSKQTSSMLKEMASGSKEMLSRSKEIASRQYKRRAGLRMSHYSFNRLAKIKGGTRLRCRLYNITVGLDYSAGTVQSICAIRWYERYLHLAFSSEAWNNWLASAGNDFFSAV